MSVKKAVRNDFHILTVANDPIEVPLGRDGVFVTMIFHETFKHKILATCFFSYFLSYTTADYISYDW